MDHPKFLVVLSLIAFFVISCASQPVAIVSPEDQLTSNPHPTVTVIPTSVPPSNTVSISQQTPLVISAESCGLANEQLPQISTPETPYTGVDVRGLVNRPLGGGVTQNGEFTIELVLHCDDSFGTSSMESYFASDINHLAVFINWRYDGPLENAPTYIIQGIEPNLQGYALPNKEQALNGGFGISRGLFKPFPDFSSKTTLRFVYIALFPSGDFSGAVLSFDLQQVSDGLQPSNVFVTSLSNSTATVTP
jgi:hypothetical protein